MAHDSGNETCQGGLDQMVSSDPEVNPILYITIRDLHHISDTRQPNFLGVGTPNFNIE